MCTLDEAKKVIGAAEKKAAAIGQPMNVAVVDAGGNLVAHIRMDGAREVRSESASSNCSGYRRWIAPLIAWGLKPNKRAARSSRPRS